MTSLKEHFDSIWTQRDLNRLPARSPRAEATARLLAGGEWLLDLGAGPGALAALTRDKFAHLVALELAFRPLPRAAEAGALAVQADFSGAALPFADEVFDALACLSALQYADDPRRVLGECHRVLKRGGQLAVILPNMRTAIRVFKLAVLGRFPPVSGDPGYDGGTRHYFCARDVFDLLTQAGFRVCWHEGLVPRPVMAAALPNRPAALRRFKAEFFCAEMVVLAEKGGRGQ
jgi:SAM-dependent methyltransferase